MLFQVVFSGLTTLATQKAAFYNKNPFQSEFHNTCQLCKLEPARVGSPHISAETLFLPCCSLSTPQWLRNSSTNASGVQWMIGDGETAAPTPNKPEPDSAGPESHPAMPVISVCHQNCFVSSYLPRTGLPPASPHLSNHIASCGGRHPGGAVTPPFLNFSFFWEGQWNLAILYLMVIHCYFLPVAVSPVRKTFFQLHLLIFISPYG